MIAQSAFWDNDRQLYAASLCLHGMACQVINWAKQHRTHWVITDD